jgi:hypothetical protein
MASVIEGRSFRSWPLGAQALIWDGSHFQGLSAPGVVLQARSR